jgi:hypothetical protein
LRRQGERPGRRKRAPSDVLGVDVSRAETPYAIDVGLQTRCSEFFFPERHAGGLTGGSGSANTYSVGVPPGAS